MNDSIESRKAKERSPSFPFISLESAINRARQFYEKEKRSSAPFSIAAGHWGYSPSSSGALQTASALKNYGLMTDEGSGSNRKLKLSDLALRIILDTRPDDTERKQFMRQAALNPNVVSDLYEKFSNELPSEATINHYLVLERGFGQATALKATAIIIENEEVTKSSLHYTQSEYTENSSQDVAGDTMNIPVSTGSISVGGSAVMHIQQMVERITGPDGQIVIQWAGVPTLKSYEFLEKYIKLRKEILNPEANIGQEDGTK